MNSAYSIEVSFDILKNYEKALERPTVDESKNALERSHKYEISKLDLLKHFYGDDFSSWI